MIYLQQGRRRWSLQWHTFSESVDDIFIPIETLQDWLVYWKKMKQWNARYFMWKHDYMSFRVFSFSTIVVFTNAFVLVLFGFRLLSFVFVLILFLQ